MSVVRRYLPALGMPTRPVQTQGRDDDWFRRCGVRPLNGESDTLEYQVVPLL